MKESESYRESIKHRTPDFTTITELWQLDNYHPSQPSMHKHRWYWMLQLHTWYPLFVWAVRTPLGIDWKFSPSGKNQQAEYCTCGQCFHSLWKSSALPMQHYVRTLTDTVTYKLQVAFGIDLNQTTWSDEFLGLRHVKGSKLSWLLQHCMKGMMKGAMHPFFKVVITLSAIDLANKLWETSPECLYTRS